MTVSKQRRMEILELSNDEMVHRFDTSHFTDADWARLETKIVEETLAFCRGNANPEELHEFARTWNWDKGTWGLQEVLDNPACEAATALLIYWRAAPEYYLQYANRDAVAAAAPFSLEAFDFLSKLEVRYVAGDFRAGSMTFDPADPEDKCVGIYDHHRAKFVRSLPAVMYVPIVPGT